MMSYDEWLDALFHGVHPGLDTLFDEDQGVPSWLVEHSTRLFGDAGSLLDRYDERELTTGLGSLALTWDLGMALWERRVPFDERAACIAAMPALFRDLFARNPLDYICHMWFDMFRPFGDDPDERASLALAEAAAEVLKLDSAECRDAALHGLGHFDHPRRRQWIDAYLRAHPELDPGVRDYALAAAEGKVL